MGRNLALVIIFGLSILGPCAVFAAGSFAGITALGRNPSSAPKVFTAMIIGLVFAQSLAIVAMLIVFQLFVPSQ
jgi:ATP synthase subunit C.